MPCPSCGTENRAGRRFCAECGAALQATCASCGALNEPDERFCGQCGQSLLEASSPRTPMPAPAPALPPSFASGRYQVQRFLGEGGKKRVYLAHDASLDRDVAVAVIKTEGLDVESLIRVKREAQSMGRLGSHPNIVTAHDIGDEKGMPYIVQEYMDGGSLEDLLRKTEGHRLEVDHAMRLGEEVCHALQHAHDQSIVHRDLKPGNIWLTTDGSAKLGDFGLAVSIDRSRLTREGMMVGTTSYMAPEQALGGEVSPRSDLYALGCAMYEMVTGRPPFLGEDSVGIISQHINTAPVAPTWHNSAVPRALEALIMRLLAKAPDERPESATAVGLELRRIRERTTEETAVARATPVSGLQAFSWGQFVGRLGEMDQLKGALEQTLSGHGSLVMLVGEPGIGKTRLAEEFGVYASLRGAQTLTGHCYEGEVALPYRPFVEAFRQYVRSRPDGELRSELGEGAPEVAKLVSEVRQRFPDIAEAPPLDPEAERLRLFESISSFVRSAAQANPLVLFLDDIHWADKPSLLMLRYLARAIANERAMIVAAYRDVELDRTHPLSDMLATLRREQPYQRVLLRGLPQDDILTLLRTLEPSEQVAPGREQLAAALFRETEGNPFFIREVLSHLVEEGQLYHEGGVWQARVSISELGIPEGVREVIGKRLTRVSEGCNRMLGLASTMTGGFTWEELRAITEDGEAALLDLLDEALAAQLVQERKGDQAGVYDFTHALIRQTLYGELSTPRRVILHRQIGRALEELHKENLEPHLAELGHHFYQAAPGGDVDKAIDYARRAGDRAVELLAYEEAASHYELALQALELKDRPDERQRYGLLMALGQAYYRADMPEQAMAILERAVQEGEELGDQHLQGEAAIAYNDALNRGPLWGQGLGVPMLESALQTLGEEDSGLRALLLAHLSQALPFGTPAEARLPAAQEALDVARRVGEFLAETLALAALRGAHQGPRGTEERLAIAEQWVQVANTAGEKQQSLMARLFRLSDLAELGDMAEVRREYPLLWELADELREPSYSGWRPIGSAMLALMEGRFDDAERFIQQYIPVALRTQNPQWTGALQVQFYDLRRAQGRLGELEETLLQLEQNAVGEPAVVRAGLALLYLDEGRLDEARAWFEKVAADDFAAIAGQNTQLSTLFLCANVARRLPDPDRAALLYEILFPYAKRQIVLPILIVCVGSASLPLGELAAALQRWDDAERHFTDALAFDEEIGARPWLARTQYEYAAMLHERGGPADDERARSLVNQALATFEELGMPKDVEFALALKMKLQGVPTSDFKTSIDAVARSVHAERPDLRTHAAPDGTVTLLFTDIEGSTALNEKLGDQRWMDVLRVHNAIVRDGISSHGGYEVKSQGDGFMIAFGSARRALQCAIALQSAIADHNRVAAESVQVRIGLHTGEAIKEADDFYGHHVNLAARIADQAQGGEILVSSLLRDLTDSAGEFAFDGGRDVDLKGLSNAQRVYEVRWHEDAP